MAAGMWRTKERLYLNRDRSRIVPQDSPEAAFVYAPAGGEIPVAEAERYGLVTVTEGKVREVPRGTEKAEEPKAEELPAPESEPEPKTEEASAETTKPEPPAERRSPPRR